MKKTIIFLIVMLCSIVLLVSCGKQIETSEVVNDTTIETSDVEETTTETTKEETTTETTKEETIASIETERIETTITEQPITESAEEYSTVVSTIETTVEETTQPEYSLIVTRNLGDGKIFVSKTGDEFPTVIYEMIYYLMEPHGDLAKFGSLWYCGEYNSSHVGLLSYGLVGDPSTSETVDGFTFVSPYYNFKYTVYKEGKTYSLTEAFIKGILTHDDIEELYWNYASNLIRYSFSLMQTDELEDAYAWYEKNYTVVDSLPKYSLDIEIVSTTKPVDEIPAIIYKMGNYYMKPYQNWAEPIGDLHYIGEYNSAQVSLFTIGVLDYGTMEEIVDGFAFVSPYGNFGYTVYRNGKIYSLTEAFENGVLTHNDLEELYSNYMTNYTNYKITCVKN